MPRKKSVSSEGASSSQPAKKFKADPAEQPEAPVRRSLRNRTQDENVEHDHKPARRKSTAESPINNKLSPRRGAGFVVKTPSPPSTPQNCPLEVSIQVTPCDLTSRTDKATETGTRKRKTKTSPSSVEKKAKQEKPEQELSLKTAEINLPRVSLDKLHLNEKLNLKTAEHSPVYHQQYSGSVDEDDDEAVPLKPFLPLYIRDDDPLLNRITVKPSHGANGLSSSDDDNLVPFSVVTYNILSEVIRKKHDKEYHEYTEEKFLDLKYRHERIIQELRYLDPDIVCLQEVDGEYFRESLLPDMKRLGYKGYYLERNGGNPEGEATFYRKSSFSLVKRAELTYKDLVKLDIECSEHNSPIKEAILKHTDWYGILLITHLRHKDTNRQLVVGNTHLAWTEFKSPDISCIQMGYAFKQMIVASSSGEVPFLLCGDFNTRVTDPAYQLAREGYLNDQSLKILQNLRTLEMPDGSINSLVNLLWPAFQHPARNITSAYAYVLGEEPVCTSNNFGMNNGVDYMWSSSLTVNSVVDVNKNVPKLPTEIYPSDHLSLKSSYLL